MPLGSLNAAPIFKSILADPEMLAALTKQSAAAVAVPIDSALRDSTYRRYYTEQTLKKDIRNREAFQLNEKDNTLSVCWQMASFHLSSS